MDHDVVECFFLEPTERVHVYLRRYAGERGSCPDRRGYHDAKKKYAVESAPVGESVTCKEATARQLDEMGFPSKCDCGYKFTRQDKAQIFRRRIYKRADTGELMTLAEAPPGAMWLAPWLARGDGEEPHLIVRLPNGRDWDIDGPSENGNGWTREGEPPNVTARPSIGMPWPPDEHENYYHGWLRGGQLVSA